MRTGDDENRRNRKLPHLPSGVWFLRFKPTVRGNAGCLEALLEGHQSVSRAAREVAHSRPRGNTTEPASEPFQAARRQGGWEGANRLLNETAVYWCVGRRPCSSCLERSGQGRFPARLSSIRRSRNQVEPILQDQSSCRHGRDCEHAQEARAVPCRTTASSSRVPRRLSGKRRERVQWESSSS